MFLNLLKFEWKYWRKQPAIYLFPGFIFLFCLCLFTLENFTINTNDITFHNSSVNIFSIYAGICFFLPLFSNRFVSSAITRDFEHQFAPIVYSTPTKRLQLLFSRFMGGVLVVNLIFLSIPLADIVATLAPWKGENLHGNIVWAAHAQYYILFGVPNIFLVGAILFAVAVRFKNNNAGFLASIIFIVANLLLRTFLKSVDNKTIVFLFDPFGTSAAIDQVNKWTVYEKNTAFLKLTLPLLFNRMLWITVACGLWAWAFNFFSIDGLASARPKKATKEAIHYVPKPLPQTIQRFNRKYKWLTLHHQAKMSYWNIVKSPIFLIIAGLMLMVLIIHTIMSIQNDSLTRLPTTYNVLDSFKDVSTIFSLGILFFTGFLIWKERESKINELYDTLPQPTATMYLSKLLAILYLLISFNLILMVFGIVTQLGQTPIEWGLYFKWLFLYNLFLDMCFAIFCLLLQVIINNKMIAFFAAGLWLIVEPILMGLFKVQTNLFGISPRLPAFVYSDMYGFGYYAKGLLAFGGYWVFVYLLFVLVSILFFVRGNELNQQNRKGEFLTRWFGLKWWAVATAAAWVLYTVFLFHQTQIKNSYFSTKEINFRTGLYEKKFKQFQHDTMPKVLHVDYKINLYPAQQKYDVSGRIVLINKSTKPIPVLYFNNNLRFNYTISIPHAKLIKEDKTTIVNFQTYQFEKPLQPNDSTVLTYTYQEFYEGIENELQNQRLMPNGTFLDFQNFTPIIGYASTHELSEKKEREKQQLVPKIDNQPTLVRGDNTNRFADGLGGFADWVTVHSIVSTESDQTAIAPGDLIKKWTENNRNYFEYAVNQPSKFSYAVASAKYKKATDTSSGVACEVYYHPSHAYNVPLILKTLKNSIAYYSDQYGSYKHAQARIVEFPRFAKFAQSFPGTMFYSESFGFTDNVDSNTQKVNTIYQVVAHEMAHQWWAHQVSGAYVEGSELLSESLAEYSSTMLLRRAFGMDMTAKFLKQENSRYITERAEEVKKEPNLLRVDNQMYVRYQKGNIVLFGLQQWLGEQAFNGILKNLVDSFAYRQPPYPTAFELYDRVLAITPDSIRYLVKDGFEKIIIFDNEIEEASTKQLSSKQYQTTLRFNMVKNETDPNNRETKNISSILLGQSKSIPINDHIEIALFDKETKHHRYGKTLSIAQYKISKKENELVIVTNGKPTKAVIDPYFRMLHKDPSKNGKNIR